MSSRQNKGLYTRRDFLKTAGAAALAMGVAGCPAVVRPSKGRNRIIVLAVDGMDPRLMLDFIRAGGMKNCKALMEQGCFYPLRSSDPPQSPVAWSNFISGTNPGGHGIFDFIARDAPTLKPFLSTSRISPPDRTLRLGKFSIPVSGGEAEQLRKGPAVWDIIAQAGIDSTAIRAPVNFPPVQSGARTISGLATPDIHGSYGIFSFFTDSPEYRDGPVSGGQIQKTYASAGRYPCVLKGPANTFRRDGAGVDIPFEVQTDAGRTMAQIVLGEDRIILRPGEWSEWVRIKFPMLPVLASASGICRFYLKRTEPHLELYASPVNIDPSEPALPVSSPEDFSRRLVREVGSFYTQGMPEDTSALSAKVFGDDDYRVQATLVHEETLRLFDHALHTYNRGFLYFYFSSLDLNSHAFWRTLDAEHPLYDPEVVKRHGDFLPWLYESIDSAVGRAAGLVDEHTTLYVISDHGFTSFRRQFNLNSWLMDNGYARARSRFDRGHASFFGDTDWSGTKAYGLGINSLYLNLRGREPEGTVGPGAEAEALKDELIARLKAERDPATGQPPVTNVFRPEEIYSGPFVSLAPDLIVCYNMNYRASWDTVLGKYPREVFLDNLDPWSGDHCMDAQFLPGVFLCSRPSGLRDPALTDLAPSILSSCGIPVPREMTGRDLFA
ncbi:MAG TPA: alkaline phosphatase family protein [Kiritimatiellia bacterium]|nr:alkaline phosphatase family protein [Kiritimatiellia bacterium]HNS80652.1 alkaline phosphatase family protein [Kiritimatiellia bacterium]